MVLGIETSCDETSVAVVRNGREVLSNVISSQVDLHKKYGGVVPEIASRRHVELIIPVIDEALQKSGTTLSDIDAIGVTYGPGLVGALLVGLSAAKAMAYSLDIPLVGVHHIEGHIAANYIQYPELKPPFVCLVASGGHSHIVCVEGYKQFKILGQTRDDAAGEAFDKIARAIGLGYPGGPLVDKISRNGNKKAIKFPRVYLENSLDFSFSGLKTAVINHLHNANQKNIEISIEDICASFQDAVVDVLTTNLIKAAKAKNILKVALAGGVAANSALRESLEKKAERENLQIFFPRPVLCTDNAAMIACAAYYEYREGRLSDLYLNAVPNLKLGL